MKKSIHFIPSSLVCSVAIDLTVEDGVIREVCFEGGCSGNLQGISMLVRGPLAMGDRAVSTMSTPA